LFFFEKKNQKTFAIDVVLRGIVAHKIPPPRAGAPAQPPPAAAISQSFSPAELRQSAVILAALNTGTGNRLAPCRNHRNPRENIKRLGIRDHISRAPAAAPALASARRRMKPPVALAACVYKAASPGRNAWVWENLLLTGVNDT
jgi:hypothetical protein